MGLGRSSVNQTNKAVLDQNIFSKGKQLFDVDGLNDDNIIILTRGEIVVEQGVIELPDKTNVSGGRTNSGEFDLTVQLSSNTSREYFQSWYEAGLDKGNGARGATFGQQGYKRAGKITYLRHDDRANAILSGNFVLYLEGMFPSKMSYTDYDMAGGDEGDAQAILTMTIKYDWAGPNK